MAAADDFLLWDQEIRRSVRVQHRKDGATFLLLTLLGLWLWGWAIAWVLSRLM